jgi:nitrite reductase/ring-hydroxylating ferredoxin subunit
MDDGWVPVIESGSLEDRRAARVDVDGEAVLVVRDGDRLLAIGDRCTHRGAPLHRGRLTFSGSIAQVTCPVHGSLFDLATGKVMRGPATQAVPAYDARVNGAGTIEVRRRD